jgi:cytochrome c oxidase subunit 1
MSGAGTNYLNNESGIMSWLTSRDHKRIGLLYFYSIGFFFFLGGLAAMMIRTELFQSGSYFDPALYNRFMTYHGVIMVFFVIVPGIPAILGNIIMPLHLGARDVAFPTVNLMSWYCYMAGGLLAIASLFMGPSILFGIIGGADTGWTFYTPYSINFSNANITAALAAFVAGFSSILTGVNFVATVHKLRCPGMTMKRITLFTWSLYSTAILQVLATPVVGITVLLLVMENIFGIGVFDPELGGDPVLFQHFFWFYSHPAVYIMILPAMGVISELITTFSKKTIFGYTAIAYSSLAIAAVSFLVWGHHMFTSSQSEVAAIIFSVLTMLVGVPTAIKLFNWLATLYKGSIQMQSPMLYALGFMFIFTIGGVTGIFLSTIATDIHFHDTYFVVAHFHYVMVGGTLMAIMGGAYYWFPKITGKMFSEPVARMSWIFIFIGFNVTFFPQFILGAMGMPRRYADYLPAFESLNKISSLGSYMIGLGFLIALYSFVQGARKGPKAPMNPWGSKTLEWTIPSPPPHENFEEIPTVTAGPYEYR